MEIIKDNAAMLTNYEVLTLLSDIQAGRGQKKPDKSLQQLATITYEAVKYLEDKPCKTQSPEIIEQFMKDVQPYKLTKSEKVQLLNQYPSTAVEIQLIVEESEERLTEDQIYELLEVIGKYRPSEALEEGEGEEEEEEDDMEEGEEEEITGQE
ncbi:DNA-directed RNA polymerase III subunit RPC9-like [Mizuhopecten yessoensis]|uniref:DNA-directed RNA polymerase III subunit RPC9 n=1 Tax=Mizuhopecten yessoensis TaxID=6573 RepID=A0A210PRH5_MIZYE|nr:DNA-directed RNA polymerase III subunit RPC9-like [Mizuhopecten yessoensis]OWF39090.1 DNA-directed RNA polymerase III subunit RPC9 [Mizuhopecten yessoensis]